MGFFVEIGCCGGKLADSREPSVCAPQLFLGLTYVSMLRSLTTYNIASVISWVYISEYSSARIYITMYIHMHVTGNYIGDCIGIK